MKRTLFAGVFALLGLALTSSTASAQLCSPFSGGLCFKMFPHIHQQGPLYNYGPYSGYYPFEPYGPWNAQLRYTGPYPTTPGCGWNGCGLGLGGHGHNRGGHSLCNKCGGHSGLFSKWFGSSKGSGLGTCNECGAGHGLGHGLGHGWLNGSWGLSRFGGATTASSCSSGTCGGTATTAATSSLACGSWGCGKTLGWGDYAKTTFKNIFYRTHPCSQKATCPVECATTCNSLCK